MPYLFLQPVRQTRIGKFYGEGQVEILAEWKKGEVRSAEKAGLIEKVSDLHQEPTSDNESMVDYPSVEGSLEVQDG